MSEEKKYTERDLVLAKRGAYRMGAAYFGHVMPEHIAAGVYPLPPITRRRVLRFGTESDTQVRVGKDASAGHPFEYRCGEASRWYAMSLHRKYATPGTVYGDLLLSPDETVPDDGGAE